MVGAKSSWNYRGPCFFSFSPPFFGTSRHRRPEDKPSASPTTMTTMHCLSVVAGIAQIVPHTTRARPPRLSPLSFAPLTHSLSHLSPYYTTTSHSTSGQPSRSGRKFMYQNEHEAFSARYVFKRDFASQLRWASPGPVNVLASRLTHSQHTHNMYIDNLTADVRTTCMCQTRPATTSSSTSTWTRQMRLPICPSSFWESQVRTRHGTTCI